MLIMGWDGTEVTPQIRSLIEQHHLGSILLTAKNLKCRIPAVAQHTLAILTDLQPPNRRHGSSRNCRPSPTRPAIPTPC
jgi:beta-N-acetylhexosaminidase